MSLSIGNSYSFAPNVKQGIPPYSDGGIIEQPDNKPKPGVLEERSKTYDFEKGEWVYTDEYLKNKSDGNVCYLA